MELLTSRMSKVLLKTMDKKQKVNGGKIPLELFDASFKWNGLTQPIPTIKWIPLSSPYCEVQSMIWGNGGLTDDVWVIEDIVHAEGVPQG